MKDKIECYSYILGIYLGDGYIHKTKRSHRIRITLDKKYFNIIQECAENFKKLFPNNIVNIKQGTGRNINAYVVSLYSCNLLKLFPQSGIGYKYNRDVSLKEFQINMIDNIQLIKGLFHSDGCLYKSKTGKNKKYISFFYNFTNMSKNIIDIYCNALDSININYTVNKNKKNIFTVNVYKKIDFAKLYSLIGLKNLNHKFEIDDYCDNIKIKNKLKKIKPIAIKNYCECGREIKKNSKQCENCYNIRQRKVKDRPSKEELILMIKESSLEAVGRKYNVSGNAVKKWL